MCFGVQINIIKELGAKNSPIKKIIYWPTCNPLCPSLSIRINIRCKGNVTSSSINEDILYSHTISYIEQKHNNGYKVLLYTD